VRLPDNHEALPRSAIDCLSLVFWIACHPDLRRRALSGHHRYGSGTGPAIIQW
jgi:hypothetical protein